MRTKADLIAFLGGVGIVLVGKFILSDETDETFVGISLQGFAYVIGLIAMAYAILPQYGAALLDRLGLKLKAVRVEAKSDPDVDDSDPPPPPKKHPHHKR